ncbi:serine hydrolase domain-containing protein [Sandarakinorhabdus oryzae]|uniref:serine hydrolase domain-containing protein n=1 Tax=Sandarakinorhabdus oryzae TaxID=2675220 RepID=UPI0012E154A0|nr:serine hydrolase [Sandarakinorhabdus oryzae]
MTMHLISRARTAGLVAGAALALLAMPDAARAGTTPATFPAARWDTPRPDLPPACRAVLDHVRRDLAGLPTTAMMVVSHGRPILTLGRTDKVSYVASARKSLLALLFGNDVERGTVDLDRTLAQIGIDEDDGLLPIERQARLRDLMTARSGVYHAATNAGDDTAFAPPRGSQPPGSYFLYNNWDFNAAGTAFERLTGRTIYAAFETDIARPLQMQDFSAGAQRKQSRPERSRHPAYHFDLSTRDMARIGLLMLNDGRWGDRQVEPASWVRQITTPTTRSSDMHPDKTAKVGLGFGTMWWLFEEPDTSPLAGAYLAWGYLGQYILVVPRRDLVIAHKVAPRLLSGRDVPLSSFLGLARQIAATDCG